MGIPFTAHMVFLFTITPVFLFTTTMAFQLTISTILDEGVHAFPAHFGP